MESFFERYRNLLVLLAILVAQIIGLAMQVRSTAGGRNSLDPRDGSGVRLIRLWADLLVSPPERIIHSSKMGVGGVWQDYIDLRHVREQNQDLQKTVDRLRLEQASLLEDAKEGQRLQTLLGFQQKYIYTTVVAEAIGTSGSDQSRVFYINKGSSDGLQRDNAVITADGIVGKVRDVFPHSAQVLGINDQTSGAGVILETTRIRGILRGNAAGQPQIVDILADQRIQPGEKVFTAGGDQIFPRGLPVGVVEKVVRDPDRDSFIDVIVKPAANLERLDEVLVITSTEPHFSPQDQQDLATSEQLKGAEAEAIKEQQKASEIKAERLPGLTDPNLPPDQQPLLDNSNPNGVPRPPLAIHPDRFSPENAGTVAPAAKDGAGADAAPKTPRTSQPPSTGGTGTPATKTAGKPATTGPSTTGPTAAKPATPKPQANPGAPGALPAATKPAGTKPPATAPERNP
jgi:rod shape-determining protein MreC